MDNYVPGWNIHLFPLPDKVTGFLAINLDGRMSGRDLLDGTTEFRQSCFYGSSFWHNKILLFQHFPRIITAVRGDAQADFCPIGLVRDFQILDEPGCLPNGYRQYPCCRRVQGSCMTHPFLFQYFAHKAHHIMGTHAGRLEQIDKA